MGQKYVDFDFQAYSFASIPCLEFLWGSKWDDIAKAWISSLRPSRVRVSDGAITCDAMLWRVTVMLREDGAIAEITQEVQVSLPDGVDDGHDLTCKSPAQAEANWGEPKGEGTCPSCTTPLSHAPGIGPYCPNKACDRIDDVGEGT